MSRSAKVRLDWAEDEHDFRLAIGQLDEYDDLCGCGPGFALGLLQAGVYANWKPRMVREAIRLGLIGGGMDPHQALRLVKRYVDARPIGESLATAQAILLAAVVGAEEEPAPELSGTGSDRSPSQTDASGSEPSTPSEPPSASTAPRSETSASGSLLTPATVGRRRMARKTGLTRRSSTASRPSWICWRRGRRRGWLAAAWRDATPSNCPCRLDRAQRSLRRRSVRSDLHGNRDLRPRGAG